MSPPSQLQKAFLETESGTRINCMFNPAKFSFSTSNRWESDTIPGKSSPTKRFAGVCVHHSDAIDDHPGPREKELELRAALDLVEPLSRPA